MAERDQRSHRSLLTRIGAVAFIGVAAWLLASCDSTPVNVTAPTITGVPGIALTLHSSDGTWQGGSTSYTYAWQRCDTTGDNCAAIGGATASTYTVATSDSGSTLRVTVTATNTAGSAAATSDPTGPVAAPHTCPVAGSTTTWTGGAGTAVWSTAANWSTNTVPNSASFACLPADTPVTQPIAIGAISVKQIASFKPVAMAGNVTTTSGADFEAAVTWSAGNMSGPLQIGVDSSVTVSGGVFDYAATTTNAGSVKLVDGGNLYVNGVWLNSGRFEFANNNGTSALSPAGPNSGRIINTATGTIIKTGTAAMNQILAYVQIENDGTVTAQSGSLQWANYESVAPTQPAPGDNISTGNFTSTGTANITFIGNGINNIAAGATLGQTIYDYGNLTGTITVPAGATLTLGNTTTKGYLGGTVTGAGTLIANGPTPANCCNASTLAADLLIPTVQVNDNVSFSNKPDSTPLQIGTSTTVTLVATPTFFTSQFINNGTIDFGTNAYFPACNGCSVTNNNTFIVRNDDPDGNFTRTFLIASGTFQNNGVIREVGYLPGVAIKFLSMPYANVTNKGAAEFDHLLDPTWVTSLKSDDTVRTVAAAVSQTCTGLIPLVSCAARNLGLRVASAEGHIGAGSCANLNLNFVVVGATAGACIVIDPAGNQGVVVTLAAGAAITKNSFTLNPFDVTKLFSFDAGGQIFWRSGAAADHEFAIAPPNGDPNDVDGPAWCQSGSEIIGEGVVVTHCWNPADGVPFQLDMTPILREGVHSLYVGAGVGGSLGFSTQLAYSFLIPCGRWTNVTGLTCPPVNTAVPTVTGTLAAGQTLTANPGTWASSTTPTFTYQWMRCTSTNTCTQVSTAISYPLTTADRGNTFTITVTGSNSGGSVSAVSAKTAAVP
jgi:hypothetical protein